VASAGDRSVQNIRLAVVNVMMTIGPYDSSRPFLFEEGAWIRSVAALSLAAAPAPYKSGET
jgi:hypothetical protein